MSEKISCVLSGLLYPVTMLRFFWDALQKRGDVDLFVIGPFFDQWIPWAGGITLPKNYVKYPQGSLPRTAANVNLHPEMIRDIVPKDIDLWVQCDAGWRFSSRPPGKVVAHIQTDPHTGFKTTPSAYPLAKSYSDLNFCMQLVYQEPDEIYLPYASHDHCYPLAVEKEYDVCMIGLQYKHRLNLAQTLRRKGYNVKDGIGIVFDEYNEAYNRSKIAVSWSSLQDTPVRVWEALSMGVPLVANRTPDLLHWWTEGEHFLGFDGPEEAVLQIGWLMDHYEEAEVMAAKAYKKMKFGHHHFDDRVQQILKAAELV